MLWARGVLAFTLIPYFSFCPSPWSIFGCPSRPPTAPAQVRGALLCGASLSLPVSCHLLLAGLRDSLFLLIQATRIFGHRTNLCPIFCFFLSMILLWKQIPFLKSLFILSAFMSSAIVFKKVSGTAFVSMKSSSRSSDP